MTFSIYDASAPMFVTALANMATWLDKAGAEKDEAALLDARLASNMRPLTSQYQFASDTAKFAIARLTGTEAPSMADTETSFAELKARCQKTIDFINGVSPQAFADAATREVTLKFPGGTGYRFEGAAYLSGFALPNFYFHVTTAYAILRSQGVSLGKPDYLQHLGAPVSFD